MAKEQYVPVTGDDWYQRRRNDAEGEYFRKVADQGPRKGEGGATRQGIYMFTADGKLLAYKNAGQLPDVMRDVLKRGLAEWSKLPEERRKPGAVKVGDLDRIDRRYDRAAGRRTGRQCLHAHPGQEWQGRMVQGQLFVARRRRRGPRPLVADRERMACAASPRTRIRDASSHCPTPSPSAWPAST